MFPNSTDKKYSVIIDFKKAFDTIDYFKLLKNV